MPIIRLTAEGPRLLGSPETDAYSFATLAEWLTYREGPSVALEPGDDPGALLPLPGTLQRIAVSFPRYTDGRGYSQAQLLRRRYGWTGELHAIGHVLVDQVGFMARAGFDVLHTARAGVDEVAQALGALSLAYQPAADDRVPLFRKRGG